jgi:aspartyl-tRNA(Asn)/glutamyl-tRNA(Gln) amidotransferase subunit A
MHLHDLTIQKLHDGLLEKQFSAFEITEAYFEHIGARDHEVGAYLTLTKDLALRQAEAIDIAIARGDEIGSIAGVPVAIKDSILLKGEPATAGSRALEQYRASYDATVTAKLKAAGAIILGKTNLDEFAMGSSTEHSAFHVTKNPHDESRVPGGSSGGSAAAVAAHLALSAIGSDTGGSIRQPASFCGVVGLKPTYGAVSRFGLIALASSLDQIGPMTRSAADAALLFQAIAGRDPSDSTSVAASYDDALTNQKLEDIKRLRIGIPDEYFGEGISPEVAEALDEARRALESLGLSFRRVSLPHTKYALSCYYIIMPAEASANLARYDGIRYASIAERADSLLDRYVRHRSEGFGTEVKRRIMLGTFALSAGYYEAYYGKAQRVRRLIKNDFSEAFRDVDVLFAPVSPTTAFPIGERIDDPLSMYRSDVLTIPASLSGLPAVSIPVKQAHDNQQQTTNNKQPTTNNLQPETNDSRESSATGRQLPIGFQLIGKPFREADILGIGQFYERL